MLASTLLLPVAAASADRPASCAVKPWVSTTRVQASYECTISNEELPDLCREGGFCDPLCSDPVRDPCPANFIVPICAGIGGPLVICQDYDCRSNWYYPWVRCRAVGDPYVAIRL